MYGHKKCRHKNYVRRLPASVDKIGRCKYEELFLIMQIFFLLILQFATVEGFDFLAGGCYHQDKKKERLEISVREVYSPSSR